MNYIQAKALCKGVIPSNFSQKGGFWLSFYRKKSVSLLKVAYNILYDLLSESLFVRVHIFLGFDFAEQKQKIMLRVATV
jgi:hypothetical protein